MERLRRRERQEAFERCDVVGAELAVWAETVDFTSARPSVPVEIKSDRAYDSWEVLLAIAEEAGGTWPERARKAAVEIETNTATSDDSEGIQLLWAIRCAFDRTRLDRLSTEALLTEVCSVEELPFRAWWWDAREGTPTKGAPAKLAGHLKEYKITPRSIRLPDGTTPKGYMREGFQDTFNRYLPALTAAKPPQPPHPSVFIDESVTSEPPQADRVAASENAKDPVFSLVVAAVADPDGEELTDDDIEREFARLYPETNGHPQPTPEQKRQLILGCLAKEAEHAAWRRA